MTELSWMSSHTLQGMTEDELGLAWKRLFHYIPQCICGESLTDFRSTTHILCDECSRMYIRLQQGVVIMAHGAVLETLQVVFNGNITTKTFTWEM